MHKVERFSLKKVQTFKTNKNNTGVWTLDFIKSLSLLEASLINITCSRTSFSDGVTSNELQNRHFIDELEWNIWDQKSTKDKRKYAPKFLQHFVPNRYSWFLWIPFHKMQPIYSDQDCPNCTFKTLSRSLESYPVSDLQKHWNLRLLMGKFKSPSYNLFVNFLEAIISSATQKHSCFRVTFDLINAPR